MDINGETVGFLPRRVVEVKLATVFYGGVSLAVYMFGQTMEIFSLLQASRILKAYSRSKLRGKTYEVPEAALTGTVKVYFNLLLKIFETYNIQLDVTIDVLSGTSAGGINAISLAKALACDGDLKTVRSIWLDKADWKELIFSKDRQQYQIDSKLSNLWGARNYTRKNMLVSLLNWIAPDLKRWEKDGDIPQGSVSYAAEQIIMGSPLFDGQKFDEVLNDAVLRLSISGEQRKNSGLSLPPGDSYPTLFVTATEQSSTPRTLHVSSVPHEVDSQGGAVQESGYGRTMKFNVLDGDFDTNYSVDPNKTLEEALTTPRKMEPKDAMLGLAARATSAFPCAFPGTTLSDHVNYAYLENEQGLQGTSKALADRVESIKDREAKLKGIYSRRADRPRVIDTYRNTVFPEIMPSTKDPFYFDTKVLVDGGLVNNKPFDPVIELLQRRRQSRGNVVDRRLLYLDPHPNPITSKKRESKRAAKFLLSSMGISNSQLEQGMASSKYVETLQKRKCEKEDGVQKEKEDRVQEVLDAIKEPWSYSYTKGLSSTANAVSSEPVIKDMQEIDQLNVKRDHSVHTQLRYLDSIRQQLYDADQRGRVLANADKKDFEWDFSKGRAHVFLGDYEDDIYPRQLEIYVTERRRDTIEFFLQVLSHSGCLNLTKNDADYYLLRKYLALFHRHDEVSTTPTAEASQRYLHSLEDIVSKDPLWARDAINMAARMCSDTAFNLWSDNENAKAIEKSRLKAADLLTQKITQLDLFVRDMIKNQNRFVDSFRELAHNDKETSPKDDVIINSPAFQVFSEGIFEMTKNGNKFANHVLTDIQVQGRQFHPTVWRLVDSNLRSFWKYDLQSFGELSEGLGSYSPVSVVPLSPESSTHILSKLRNEIREKGEISFADVFIFSTDFAHFAGFFGRDKRENDYLWGRLDGAESMCKLLADTTRSQLIREAKEREILGNEVFARGIPSEVDERLKMYTHTEAAHAELLDQEFLKEIFEQNIEAREFFTAIGRTKKRMSVTLPKSSDFA